MFKEEKFTNEPEVNLFDGGAEDEFFLSQFKVLGRKYFPRNSELQSEPDYILKTGNKFFELTKNTPIDEFFIRMDRAPFFWMYDSPLVKFIKNFYRLGQRAKSSPSNNSILTFIEYYEKWTKSKSLEEKKYFAGSAVAILEHRNFTKNFFLQLLNATIKIFDKSFFDPVAASDILNQTLESILGMNMDSEMKNEMCYYINLFNGFSHLAQGTLDKAGYYFNGALVHKKDGINARFYSALTEVKLLNNDFAMKRFVELYDNDIDRLKYALEQNHVHLFTLLCEYNISQNFFAHDDFARIVVDVNQEINNRIGPSEVIYTFVKNKVIDYNHVEHMIPKSPEQGISIQTVDLLIHKFARSTNLAFLTSLPLLEDKFVSTINEIISNIEAEFEKQVQEKLNTFHVMIAESNLSIQQLHKELESAKTTVKAKVEKSINEAKARIEAQIAVYEDKIKNIDQLPELNPLVTFKNGMSYNIFISLIILLVVGFATYSNSSHITEISNFRSMISTIIFAGTKWGIISFIIGMVFSAVQASSTVMDRNYRRQNLVHKIQSINERRESELSIIRKEGDEIERKMIERLKDRITYHEGRIVKLEEEKEKEAIELRKKFQEQLDEDTKELRKLLVP
jgi:hypothetical protein